MRVVILFFLCFMMRSFDMVFNVVFFDFVFLQEMKVCFIMDQVEFNRDGFFILVFFGIKNDVIRVGFEVRVFGIDNMKVDFVRALRSYIDRIQDVRNEALDSFVFVFLTRS